MRQGDEAIDDSATACRKVWSIIVHGGSGEKKNISKHDGVLGPIPV